MTSAGNVLVVGAGGFIGGHLVHLLLARGHAVTCAGRQPELLRLRYPACAVIGAELGRDGAGAWTRRLIGIDAVVNVAGALRGDLDGVQRRGAMALLDACEAAEIARVVQVSALGAGVQQTAFLTTKAAADAHLMARANERAWCVVRPSLVIGRGGASTALFSALAALPRPLRLGPGNWALQPIHVDDLVRAIADLIACATVPACLDLVGPAVMTTDELTACLRSWLALPPRAPLTVPACVLRIGAALGSMMPRAALTRDSLAMLRAGNTAAGAPAAAVLGWSPRPITEALAAQPSSAADRLAARMLPVGAVLTVCLAAVWIGTGAVSLLVSSARAEQLLAGLAITGRFALVATRVGAVLDLTLGLALLYRPWRRPALMMQLGVMAGYSLLASVALPALWTDPFGPLLKNLAVLGASVALLTIEEP